MFRPLEGITVVDVTQILAGPFATYQLALLGANVIKIERPGEGDWTRGLGHLDDLSQRKMGLTFVTQNAQKKSVAIDLKTKEGLALVHRLIERADVFVENFKPGVAARIGLGFDALRALQPKLVYCSISAYGQSGPMHERPGYDHVIQGMCGVMKTTGKPGAGPTKVGAPYVDYATGMNATLAVVAALREIERTQEAVHLDVAMLDTSLILMASLLTSSMSSDWKPQQMGNEAWSASPTAGAYETADGTLMLAANTNAQFHQFCKAISREDLSSDERYRTGPARRQNAKSLRETLDQTFLQKSAAEWEDLLSAQSVSAARVRSLDETVQEDHFKAREIVSSFPMQGDTEHDVFVPRMGFMANGQSSGPASPPPELGADTDGVLEGLGLSADELKALRQAQVIG